MRAITRGLMLVAMAMGVALLVIVARRREHPRRMRAGDPPFGDFVDGLTPSGDGYANGHRQEAFEEF